MSAVAGPERTEPDAGSGRIVGWVLRMTAVATILIGVVAVLVVSHTPPRAGSAPASQGTWATSGLFYRASNQMSFRRGGDGLYRIEAEISERPIRFVLDAKVASVVLSPDDAQAAGLGGAALDYSGRVVTIAGETRIAPVTIPFMTIDRLTLFNVQAFVAERPVSESILGLSFLKRFDSYDMRGDELVLRW